MNLGMRLTMETQNTRYQKKVMFTKCHIDCPEELILLKSMHNKQQNKLPQAYLALHKIFKNYN